MNSAFRAAGPAGECMVNAMQRTIRHWDLLRRRSKQHYAQKAKAVPHVLNFEAELVLDARNFANCQADPAIRTRLLETIHWTVNATG